MKNKSLLHRIIDKYFSQSLEFRVRLFNILASFGVLVSLLSGIASIVVGDNPLEYIIYLIFGVISVALLLYSEKTGQYQRCYIITIVLIFLIRLPFFFFAGGGYHGAMPYFFVFAILFTIFMLEGRNAIFMSVLELVIYIGISIYARLYLVTKPEYLGEDSLFFESAFGFSVVSISLGICLYLHFKLYNE